MVTLFALMMYIGNGNYSVAELEVYSSQKACEDVRGYIRGMLELRDKSYDKYYFCVPVERNPIKTEEKKTQ